ncbi:hypothetical protein Bhyg_02973 [Pseudolycoriella hygida]|uniref:Uncharacterized protein n=1 Tax=Pseudolycoriella hygida TaxID=35572 RepID=A0A9Q0S8X4_9DIPT|nr:hypothetical protein Bhyg_02973 [Pseudolycoriella hygida]
MSLVRHFLCMECDVIPNLAQENFYGFGHFAEDTGRASKRGKLTNEVTTTARELLSNKNHFTRKYKVELLLIKEGLWKAIRDDAPAAESENWTDEDVQARAITYLMVDDSIYNKFKSPDSSTTTDAINCWIGKKNRRAKLNGKSHK